MTAKSNKAKVRRWVDEGWNQGNFSLAGELFADGYRLHDPAQPDLEPGVGTLQQFIEALRRGIPNLHLDLKHMVAEGDIVAWHFVSAGKHDGDLVGIGPTGRMVRVSGMMMSRFEDGRIVEEWANYDALGMVKQIHNT